MYAEIVGLNRMHACTVWEEPLEWTRPFHIMEAAKALYGKVSVGASKEAERGEEQYKSLGQE